MGLLAQQACGQILGSPSLPSSETFPSALGALGQDWLLLAALALMVSALALSLVHIFGNFLRNQQLIAWTKFEVFQMFATALVVMVTAFLLFGICSFDMGFLSSRYVGPGGAPMNMYQVLDVYFSSLEWLGGLLFGYLLTFGSTVSFLANIVWYSNPLGVGSQEMPLQSFSQLNNITFLLVSGYVVSWLILLMQQKMLDYIAFAVLFYLFPFGIFFRAFEPTRQFGGTLLGLSLSLLFFYPMLLVFNDYIIYEPAAQSSSALGAGLARVSSTMPGGLPTGVQVIAELPTLADPTQRDSLVSGVTGTIFFLLKPLMVFFFAAVVLPVINFIVLVEITRSLTKLLGEEIDVSNLTRLI